MGYEVTLDGRGRDPKRKLWYPAVSQPPGIVLFPLDSAVERSLHSNHARKEVVQWTVAINRARWLTLRFVLA
jgi:hypothetical protein